MRPLLLDLFCCQGGAGKGYSDAGFDVIGIDINDQPRYFNGNFMQHDALAVLQGVVNARKVGHHFFSRPVAAIHASPPCQAYTNCQRIRGNAHPDLVAPTRKLLEQTGVPWVMENVVGAPLCDPVMLCGAMFPELRVYRHRLFESNVELAVPEHPQHIAPLTKMGRRLQPGHFMHVVGNFSGAADARVAMGIPWMTRDGLRESIPPAYTQHIGRQLLAAVSKPLAQEQVA